MELNEKERTVLLTVLDMHLQGMHEAELAMSADHATLPDFDTFVDVMQDATTDRLEVEAIRRKVVNHDNRYGGTRTASALRALRAHLRHHVGRGLRNPIR